MAGAESVRTSETAPAGGGTNPAESGAPLAPLLLKEGKTRLCGIIIFKIILDT